MSNSLRIVLEVSELFTAQGLSKAPLIYRAETRRENTRSTKVNEH